MAAAVAAPAMLCYVTRPDAVLMEVEVEAKANGEDCLNQVRHPGQGGGSLRLVSRGPWASKPGPGVPCAPPARGSPRRCSGSSGHSSPSSLQACSARAGVVVVEVWGAKC